MIPDLDIYRSTNVLVREHSEDAGLEAAMRADAMAGAGLKIALAICVSALCPCSATIDP